MASVAYRRAPYDALRGVVDDIAQQRFSMSVEMLRTLQETLHCAQALVLEAMNTRCSVDRLPPELLSHIFSFVPATLPTYDCLPASAAKQTYDLLPLTHVCRRWRAIALDNSSLWSTICETASLCAATNAFCARARQTPLVVHLDHTHSSAELVDILAHDAVAVAELRLCGLQNVPTKRLASELLASPAPRLQHAAIRCRARYGGSDASAAFTSVTELWGGIAPMLQTLELHDVPFLPSNHFQALTRLALSWENTHAEWALSDLLALLGRAPSLEHVSLRGLPSDLHLRHPLKHPASPPIALPRLQTLEIGPAPGYSVPLLRVVLAHLAILDGASVRLFRLDARKLPAPLGLAPPMFLAEDAQTRLAIDMTFFGLALSLHDLRSSTSFRVELTTGGATKTAFEHAVAAFVEGGVASGVRELVVRSQRAWSAWCAPAVLLDLLPRLHTMVLEDTHLIAGVADALSPSHGAAADVLCRELATLRLAPPADADFASQLVCISKDRSARGARVLQVESDV